MKIEKIKMSIFLNSHFISPEFIFYKKNGLLNKDTEILLIDDPYFDEDIEEYNWTLSCKDICSILRNLSQQIENPTLEQKIEAINYYIENDAFIDINDPENKPQGGFKIWG